MEESNSSNVSIAFACVRFKDQNADEYDIVPIDFVKTRCGKILKDIVPTHRADFIKNKYYYVYFKPLDSDAGDKEDDKFYYKAHLLYLGESKSDLKEKIAGKRLKFPNKKYCGTSSSTDIDCGSTSLQHQKKIRQKELKDCVQKRKEQKAEEELQRFYGTKQIELRAPVVDSDSDNDHELISDPAQIKLDNKKQKTTQHIYGADGSTEQEPSITNANGRQEYDQESGEPLDDDPIPPRVSTHKRPYYNQRQDKASTSLRQKSDEENGNAARLVVESEELINDPREPKDVTRRRTNHSVQEKSGELIDDDPIPPKVPTHKRPYYNQRQDKVSTSLRQKSSETNRNADQLVVESEELINDPHIPKDVTRKRTNYYSVQRATSTEESGTRNIHAPHLEHLTSRSLPDRLEKRQASKEKISTERYGLKRFDVVNGKLYLGLDYFIGQDGWTNTMSQNPQTFIRDVATIIWQEEGILNRCFDKTKVSVAFRGRSPRKEFESDKMQLLEELLDHYLKDHRYSVRDAAKHMKSITPTLARFIQDTRKPYKHLVQKQLLFPK